jgi:DNA-binding IclR family transcriptional regulator
MRSAHPKHAALAHRSLEHGLLLLEAVALFDGATLAEAAQRTGLHRGTAEHLMQTLIDRGYLRKAASSGRYELGAKPYQVAGRIWSIEELSVLATPFLAELTRRSGLCSSLAVYRAGRVTIAARREHDGPVRVVQDSAAERPIHCTAVGKAIAAWLPQGDLARLLARTRFTRRTPRTLTDRAAFQAELERVRAAGHAIDDEEDVPGIRCLAAPVFGSAGQVIGSLCALGPKSRLPYRALRKLHDPVTEIALEFSQRLGYPGRGAARR